MQIGKVLSQLDHLLFDLPAIFDHVMNQLGDLLKLRLLHAESRHLCNPHAQRAGSGKTLFVRGRLVIDDDIISLQNIGHFRSSGVTDLHDDLVRMGEAVVPIAGHGKAQISQCQGKRPGIGNYLLLVLVFKIIQLIR